MTPQPGDVIVLPMPGIQKSKVRPTVVLSSTEYHRQRPDMIVGLLTTSVHKAQTSVDYTLQDWRAAGLKYPSAFRSFVFTAERNIGRTVGRVSDRDWAGVKECITRALGD